MDFKNWITQYKDLDNLIGDLAQDISKDSSFPTGSDRLEIKQYLEYKASPEFSDVIIETFEKSWEIYQNKINN